MGGIAGASSALVNGKFFQIGGNGETTEARQPKRNDTVTEHDADGANALEHNRLLGQSLVSLEVGPVAQKDRAAVS